MEAYCVITILFCLFGLIIYDILKLRQFQDSSESIYLPPSMSCIKREKTKVLSNITGTSLSVHIRSPTTCSECSNFSVNVMF